MKYKLTYNSTQGEEYEIVAASEEDAIERVENGEGELIRHEKLAFEFQEIEGIITGGK